MDQNISDENNEEVFNKEVDAPSPNKRNGQGDIEQPTRAVTHRRSLNLGSKSSRTNQENNFGGSNNSKILYYCKLYMRYLEMMQEPQQQINIFSNNQDCDQVFWIITTICMTLFFFEIVLASFCKDGYFVGFFFWLDLLSTVSMLLDIGWVSDAILVQRSQELYHQQGYNKYHICKSGRGSRVRTRARRIVRVVRLVSLSKLYKHAKQSLEKEAVTLLAEEMKEGNQMEYNNQVQESQRQEFLKKVSGFFRRNCQTFRNEFCSLIINLECGQITTSIIMYNGISYNNQNNQEHDQRFQRRQTRNLLWVTKFNHLQQLKKKSLSCNFQINLQYHMLVDRMKERQENLILVKN